MVKPFCKLADQIEILKERKLNISNEERAMQVLQIENYYNLVNGYKLPFLRVDQGTLDNEEYRPDASFDQMHSLHMIDRNLRMVFLQYLLIFETHLKSMVAYKFSERHRTSNSYLKENSYIPNIEKRPEIQELIRILNKIIEDRKNIENHSIWHYCREHESSIPLWVLVNDMTFGNISHMYDLLDDSLRNAIAKDFSINFKREYGMNETVKAGTLASIARTATLFRNCCAHGGVLYNYKAIQRAKGSELSRILSIQTSYFETNNLFSMFAMLKVVLPKSNFSAMKRFLMSLFDLLRESISEEAYTYVADATGFKDGWDTLV